jgi:hypothetical protein
MFFSPPFSFFCGVGCDPSEYARGHGTTDCGFMLPCEPATNFVDGYEVSSRDFPHHFIHSYWCWDDHDACAPAVAHFFGDFLNFGQRFAVVQLLNPCWFFWHQLAYCGNFAGFYQFFLENSLIQGCFGS